MLSFIFLRHLSWNGTQEKKPLQPKNKWAQPSQSLLVYISLCTYEPRHTGRSTGTRLVLDLPKTLIGDHRCPHVKHAFLPLKRSNNWEEDVPCLREDVPVRLGKITHLFAFVLFAPSAVDWNQNSMKPTILRVTFWIRFPPEKHTQALNGGQRLQVQPVGTLLKNWSVLGSSPA